MAIAIDITMDTLPAWVRFAFALAMLDILLGTIASIAQKRLSSQLGYDGIMRKMAFLALLSFVWIVLHWVQATCLGILICSVAPTVSVRISGLLSVARMQIS